MDDDPAYLQPGFNPTDLKVAELRGLLLEHDVQYPSTAKKAQLVALFEQHIAPHASQILAQRNSVRASSKGIVSANDQRSTVSAPRRSSRRAKSRGSVSADDGSPVADLLDSIVVGNNDQEEVEPPKTVRRSRRRSSRGEGQSATPTPTPQKKRATETQTDTPFSMDNVFQKRSPARSTPSVAKDNRGKSPSGRRLTDFLPTPDPTTTAPPANGSRRRLEIPVSRLQPAAPIQTIPEPEQTVVKIERVDRDDDLIPAGEEFTPEEAEELEKEEQEARLVRSQNRTVESTSHSTSMIWAVVGALLCAYFVWWRKEKLEIGYCGVGKTAPHGFKLTEPSWAELLQPDCEPCPINAICKPNFKAECKPDYVLVNSAASLGGLIPIPPTCEPDTEKLRRIAILSEEAIKIIRRRAADVECGEIVPIKPKFTLREEDKTPSGTKIKAREGGPIAQGKGIDESELRQMLYELKAPKLSDLQFDELFKAALEDAASQEEMEGALEDRDSATPSLILASSSLAAISLTCSVRLSLIRTLANYRFELISAIAALIAILQINHKVQQRRQNNALVTKYVHLVLRRLAKRAEQAYKNGKEDDAAVAVVQMRDQVMQHEFSHEKRKLVWEGVQKVVECNSNVRATSREIRGEVLRCWTWIGAVGGWEEVGSGANEENSEIEFPRVVA